MSFIARFTRYARPGALLAALLGVSLALPALAQTPAPVTPPPITVTPPADEPPASGDASAGVALTLAARPALVFSGAADWDDGLRAILESFDKLREELGRAGLQPGGRPIAVFIDTDDKGFRYEAMIPLAAAPEAAVTPGQGIKLGSTPVGKAMKFEHRGSYDDIDTTYEAITAYLDEKGLEAQNLFVEEYLSTPKSADDQDMEVDIYVFVK